jgi:MerR family transcriptional regulator, mercuric resistance operon regulatory protein
MTGQRAGKMARSTVEHAGERAGRVTRGVLSKRAGCNIETVRYYERVGLMPDPVRSAGGHRLYAEEHVRRLHFIRRCRELGFTVEEIRALLGLVDRRDYTCAEIRDISVAHVGAIRRKIKDLRRLEKTMSGMIQECDGGEVPNCPVIDALFETDITARN